MKTLLIAAALAATTLSTPSVAAIYNFDFSTTGESGGLTFSVDTNDGVFKPIRGATEYDGIELSSLLNGEVTHGGSVSLDVYDDYLYAFNASPGLPEIKDFDFGTVDDMPLAQGFGNDLSFSVGSFHGYTAPGRSVFPADLTITRAVSAAPEPTVWALLGLAIGGMGLALRRKRRLVPSVANAPSFV